MSDLLNKTEFTQDDITRLIDSRAEESFYIDFKDSRALSSGDGKEIAKDVSAFANSDGGLIIYGIVEEKNVASQLSFIDGNKYNKEWLENKITGNIHQRIDNLLIFPIRFDNDISKTMYVVKIPKSLNTPHMNTSDNKYYRRDNFKSVPMHEYEVRDFYLRAKDGKVIIDKQIVKIKSLNGQIQFNIEIHVTNVGNFIAEKYRVACNIHENKNFLYTSEYKYVKTNTENCFSIATNDVIPIFPNEIINVLSFNLRFHPGFVIDFYKSSKIDISIYSQGKIETITNNSILKDIEKLVIQNSHLF